MCRRIVFALTIALLVSSAAIAGIGRFQGSAEYLDKQAHLGSGFGTVGWSQFTLVIKDQSAWSVPLAWGNQHQFSGLAQGGNIVGMGASMQVGQHMEGSAQQGQLIGGGVGPKVQCQSLELVAGQGIIKGIGLGSASAGQIAVLSESHSGGNAKGVMSESSTIIAGQKTDVFGVAGAFVGGGIGVTTTQGQAAF